MWVSQAVVFAYSLSACSGFQQAVDWQWKSRSPTSSNEQATPKSDYMFPMTEDGFRAVAALNDEDEMKSFIRRKARDEGIVIKSPKRFDGFLENAYTHKEDLSLAKLTKMLEHATWVKKGKGKTAPLTEAGYLEVAELKSASQMLVYANRILAANKKQAPSEKLMLLMPYYDGEVHTRTFAKLKRRLLTASWISALDTPSMKIAPKNSTKNSPKNDFFAQLLEVPKHKFHKNTSVKTDEVDGANESHSRLGNLFSKLKHMVGNKPENKAADAPGMVNADASQNEHNQPKGKQHGEHKEHGEHKQLGEHKQHGDHKGKKGGKKHQKHKNKKPLSMVSKKVSAHVGEDDESKIVGEDMAEPVE